MNGAEAGSGRGGVITFGVSKYMSQFTIGLHTVQIIIQYEIRFFCNETTKFLELRSISI